MPAVPKTTRIVDPKAVEECRKPYCEKCGAPAYAQPHHVRPRSLGGSDIKENLIQLCFECHRAAHDGKLHHTELVRVVAAREKMSVDDVCQAIGWPRKEKPVKISPRVISIASWMKDRTLDDLIQLRINIVTNMDDLRWTEGAVCFAMMEGMGLKASEIGSMFGCSAAHVRMMAKTFLAFPDESTRVPELSWSHHKIAAEFGGEKAREWLAEAADRHWSTRQLREAIKSSEGPREAKDVRLKKAEKVLRLTEEVFAEKDEVADWCFRKLKKVLKRYEEPAAREAAAC